MRGVAKANLPSKTCPQCGRAFAWRKRWTRSWNAVVYCSDACRRGKVSAHADLDALILELLDKRGSASSICPSEVARAAATEGWRALMPRVREAAARLAARGAIQVTQGLTVVDVTTARGAVRLRRPS